MQQIFLFFVLALFSQIGFAQSYSKLKQNEDVTVNYKWKTNEQGEQELYLKFKNTAKQKLGLNLTLGFYHTGLLAGESEIAACLKPYFWNNWFRRLHLINVSALDAGETKETIDYTIALQALEVVKVTECDTDDQ